MSEATTKALADLIYDRLADTLEGGSLTPPTLYVLSRTAAETIEAVGTTKAIIRAWLAEQEMTADRLRDEWESFAHVAACLQEWTLAAREVSS